MIRLSAVLVRGSGVISLVLIILTCEQINKSLEYSVQKSPRELLVELSEIQQKLGTDITDPSLTHSIDHGGIIEGAKKALSSAYSRIAGLKKIIFKQSSNVTEHSDQIEERVEEDKTDHKESVNEGEDDLSDPVQPPLEPTFSPSLPNPHNHQWLLNPVNRCKRDKTKFLVLIKTNEESYAVRDAIRKSWCQSIDHVTCIFIMGRDPSLEKVKIKAEYLAYKDIIMEDIEDSNDIDKVVMGMRWASKYCDIADYVLKTNHDVWVNILRFLDYFDSNTQQDHFFGGKCVMGAPDRNRNSPRYVSLDEYPESQYPIYCSDTGYLMTSDMPALIFENSMQKRPSPKFDDIYLGIVVHSLNILPRSTSGFNYGKFIVQRACEYKANAFTVQLGGKTPEGITKLIKQLDERLQKC